MSGFEPLLAAEAITAAEGATAAATAAETAATAEAGMNALAAMDAATAASGAADVASPYIMSSAEKAAMLGNTGYGPGMSGFQTSVFDTALQATGSPQIASLLAGSGQVAPRLATSAIQQAMKPRMPTTVGGQIRRGQVAANPIQSLLVEAQRKKRRNLSLL